MKVEIWSDFICPYCYIGQKAFQRALAQFEHRDYVHIEYKCYQLDEEAKIDDEKSVVTMLMEKYNIPQQTILSKVIDIAEMARKVDATIELDKINHTNTFQAHRLVKFAEKIGKDGMIVDRLFEAYFSTYKNIGLDEVLIHIAEELSMQNELVVELLNCRKYTNAITEDKLIAEEMGVEGVPFFVFNETHAMSGAQSEEVFLNALYQLWEEEQHDALQQDENAPVCTTTYCDGDTCYSSEES